MKELNQNYDEEGDFSENKNESQLAIQNFDENNQESVSEQQNSLEESKDINKEKKKISDTQSRISRKMMVNTVPLKTEDVTKIDYFLNELFESGKSKEEILKEVKIFCEENQMRRNKILEIHRRTLQRKKKMKIKYENVAQTSKTAESQKNLIYFTQCLERVKMEVASRKECDKNTLRLKNKVKRFNLSDKRRILELLLCKEDILSKVLVKMYRKMKIKDLERKVDYDQRANKYHNSERNSAFGKSGMGNRTHIEEFEYHQRKDHGSRENSQNLGNKYEKISNRHTPNSNMIQYEGSPPIHMLNQEIDLTRGNNSALGK